MGLTDLMTEIKQDVSCYAGDEGMEMKVLDQVLKLVEDKISEVKNQAVKWSVSFFFFLAPLFRCSVLFYSLWRMSKGIV